MGRVICILMDIVMTLYAPLDSSYSTQKHLNHMISLIRDSEFEQQPRVLLFIVILSNS